MGKKAIKREAANANFFQTVLAELKGRTTEFKCKLKSSTKRSKKSQSKLQSSEIKPAKFQGRLKTSRKKVQRNQPWSDFKAWLKKLRPESPIPERKPCQVEVKSVKRHSRSKRPEPAKRQPQLDSQPSALKPLESSSPSLKSQEEPDSSRLELKQVKANASSFRSWFDKFREKAQKAEAQPEQAEHRLEESQESVPAHSMEPQKSQGEAIKLPKRAKKSQARAQQIETESKELQDWLKELQPEPLKLKPEPKELRDHVKKARAVKQKLELEVAEVKDRSEEKQPSLPTDQAQLVEFRPRSKKYQTRIGKPLGPRLTARQAHRSQLVKIVMAAGSCVLLFGLVVFIRSYHLAPFYREKSVIAKKTVWKPKIRTLLFIGAKKANGKEKGSGLALVIIKEGDDRIAGWSIPDDMSIFVPGHGFEKIGVALETGVKTTIAAVKNFLGIDVTHFAKLNDADFKKDVLNGRLSQALDKADQTDLNRDQFADFYVRFEKVKPQDVNLIPIPVKPLTVGKETYFEPDREEIDRLFALIWGVSKQERMGELRVIVLNGSGVPGVGGDVAERLIEINCRVVETENANHFDYEKTQIIIYKGGPEWAAKIKKVLGVGVISRQSIPQDLADATIVVGKDYQMRKGD